MAAPFLYAPPGANINKPLPRVSSQSTEHALNFILAQTLKASPAAADFSPQTRHQRLENWKRRGDRAAIIYGDRRIRGHA